MREKAPSSPFPLDSHLPFRARAIDRSFHSCPQGNIHEIRAYNRMARAATGKYVVFLQDDDIPPGIGIFGGVLRQLAGLFLGGG